jgi:hypothetical protein
MMSLANNLGHTVSRECCKTGPFASKQDSNQAMATHLGRNHTTVVGSDSHLCVVFGLEQLTHQS